MPVVAVTAAISAVAVLPGDAVPAPSGLDTVGHLAEFALFGAVAARATNARARALTVLVLGLCLAVSTEASQLLAQQRSADLGDLGADLVGTAAGVVGWATRAGPRWHALRPQTRERAGWS